MESTLNGQYVCGGRGACVGLNVSLHLKNQECRFSGAPEKVEQGVMEGRDRESPVISIVHIN